jgi:flagellar biosynthesis protein
MIKKKQDKLRTAAAIQYDAKRDIAPRVTAKGKGEIAEKIIELARKNNVPIKEDPALVQVLYQLDLDANIPPELYKAIAEVLVFVYSLNTDWRTKSQKS